MPHYCPPPQGDATWHQASDEEWAAFAGAVNAAAAERGQDGQAQDR